MDVVIDYLGRQYIIELKIWHGEQYQEDGRRQLADYLESMEAERGWLLTFSFLKEKRDTIGIHENLIENKKIVEIIV